MTTTKRYPISNKIHLVQVNTTTTKKVVEAGATHHLMAIDCSGSMAYDLPRMREQIKNKIVQTLGEKDTLSIVWFSGRNECGVLLEAAPVRTLTDLQSVYHAVDRWIRPVGLTGFRDPLVQVRNLVAKLRGTGAAINLFFMSDGCDNQWSREEIVRACEEASNGLSSATFVEYGYYADRPLLTRMAEKAGGVLIFSQDFDSYAPVLENALRSRANVSKAKVKTGGKAVGGFAFAWAGTDLVTYEVQDGQVTVPENVEQVFYLADGEAPKGSRKNTAILHAIYAAISLYATRMEPDVVYELLRYTGDVALIKDYSKCFGKQRYSEFAERAAKCVSNPQERFVQGCDPNAVPDDDAFTVLELLEILASDEEARVLLDHPAFKYNRVGRRTQDASEVLTSVEQAEIEMLTEEMLGERDPKKVAALSTQIAIIANKPQPLKFEPAESDGYPIENLVLSESSPNVSFLVRKQGTISLSSRARPATVPEAINTHIHRLFTVVKHGVVNIQDLPVKVSSETEDLLFSRGAKMRQDVSGAIVIDVGSLPIVNRNMVRKVSAKKLFETELALTKARAEQKVLNHYLKTARPEKAQALFSTIYGEEATSWLKEEGITEGGFSPKRVLAPATDFYMGRELKVSLKGLSSLPKVDDVRERLIKLSDKKAKPTTLPASMSLMVDLVEHIETVVKTKLDPKNLVKWLEVRQSEAKTEVRKLLFEVARMKFSIIVGQVWFEEFKSLDENSMDIFDKAGAMIPCKVEMKDVEVKI